MNLDTQQQQAVETDSRKALVIAGAGSGKTRTLTERIAYLIEKKKVSPYEICAFTFTRKASQEMKSRLEARIGNQAHKVQMGTMHALGLSMLHRFGDILGLKAKNITVYCEWESAYLLKDIATDMGIYKKSWNPRKKDIDAVFAQAAEAEAACDQFVDYVMGNRTDIPLGYFEVGEPDAPIIGNKQ